MIKGIAVAATVLALADQCGGGAGAGGGGYDKAPQYPVISHRTVHDGTFTSQDQLLIGYPAGQGGARWISVSRTEAQRCPDHSQYPKCAEGKK